MLSAHRISRYAPRVSQPPIAADRSCVATAGEHATTSHEPDPQDEERDAGHPQDRGVGERVDQPRPDAIDRRVRRDRHAGRERERDRRIEEPWPRSTRHGRWSSRNPASSAATPIDPATPEPLAQQADTDRDREQRRRPARDRVDDRQVAAPVGRRQQDEVAGLDDARTASAEGDAPRPARTGRPASHHAAMPAGTIPTDAASMPDRRRPERVAGGLEPDVPGDVQAGADQDQRDDEGVHAATLAAHVPPLQAPRADEQPADREDRRDDDARRGRMCRPSAGRGACRSTGRGSRRAGRGRHPACRGRRWRSRPPPRPAPPATSGRDRRPRSRSPRTRPRRARGSPSRRPVRRCRRPATRRRRSRRAPRTITNTPIAAITDEPAAERPTGTRDRRREHEIEPSLVLVARPRGEERRAGQTGHQRGEGEERELQDARRLAQVDVRDR